MKTLTGVVARSMYGVPMIFFGFNHFTKAGFMAGVVPSYVPGGVFWVYLTGLALIAAGLSIVAGRVAWLAGPLLALLLMVFVLTVHLPGVLAGGEGAMMATLGLLKDLALAGGALLAAGVAGKGK